MRSTRTLLIVAGVVLVAGVLLITTSKNNDDAYGWFAYAPGDDSVAFESVVLLTSRQVIGWAAIWIASLVVTGVIVRGLALRHSASEGPSDGSEPT